MDIFLPDTRLLSVLMAVLKYSMIAVHKLMAAVRTFSSCGTLTSSGNCSVSLILRIADERNVNVSSISLAFPLSS